MRCFVALELPLQVQRACAAAQQPLRALGAVTWVPTERLHLTLRFLGDVDRKQAEAIARVVVEAWPAMQLELHGLGQFPPRGAPHVLWAGVRGDTDVLAASAQHLEQAAQACGLPAEARPFHPHVTLGRCKSPLGSARLSAAIRAAADAAIGAPFAAPRIVLYRSELSPAGATHTELASGRCGG